MQLYLDGVDVNLNKTKIDQYYRSELIKLNQAANDTTGETKKLKLQQLISILESIKSLPADFFATHGEEMLSIVFKLTHYNHEGIFSEELNTDLTYPHEV